MVLETSREIPTPAVVTRLRVMKKQLEVMLERFKTNLPVSSRLMSAIADIDYIIKLLEAVKR